MKPWEEYQQQEEGPWTEYQQQAEPERPAPKIGELNPNPQFSDEPDYSGLPVGTPSLSFAKTALDVANTIDRPRQAILESTPVTEADPYYVGKQGGLSPYDIAGNVAKSVLGSGGATEAAPFDITNKEDFREIADIIGRVGLDLGTMHPYYRGLNKVLGGVSEIKSTVSNYNQRIRGVVNDKIWKAIRPGKRGLIGAQDIDKYVDDATLAVQTMIKDKDILKYRDSYGYEVKNTTPRNLEQMSHGIRQELKKIGPEIDEPIKALQINGGMVDTNKIADILQRDLVTEGILVGDETAYNKALKEIAKLRNRGNGTGKMDPVDVLESIKRTNARIGSQIKSGKRGFTMSGEGYVEYYKNVLLREELDSMVNQLTGTRWQPIRDKYAAFKRIEEDTLRRTLVDLRKNKKGIMDLSDVFTGYHGARGLLEWEPSTLGAAGFAKFIAYTQKWAADPNRYVKNMFREVESLMKRRDALTTPLPKPKAKQIEWQGTIRGSGKPIGLKFGSQVEKYDLPKMRKAPTKQIELKRYYEESSGPPSQLMRPKQGQIKSTTPKLYIDKNGNLTIKKGTF